MHKYKIDPKKIYYQRLKSVEERFWEKVDKKSDEECWNWIAFKNSDGYGKFRLYKDQDMITAHRTSWILHYGNVPNGLQVLHHCDNPSCVNPKHLFLGTHQDNMNDMYKKKRHGNFKGENNKNSKLKEVEVQEIRRLYATGKIFQRELVSMFKVSTIQIKAIINKRSWRHI